MLESKRPYGRRSSKDLRVDAFEELWDNHHSMDTAKIRWGILGTAGIARKNWKSIFNSGNSTLTAVASRDLEKARRFITECQADARFKPEPRAFGNYQELLASKEVDAVYLPIPTATRKEWMLRAAEAGKHIVCEKPCTISVADLEEVLEVCRKNRVQFMDGVMFVHSQRYERMGEVLNDRTSIGQIRRISSAFSFRATEEFFANNIRAHSELEPHGCLGDLGWYSIRFSLWAMNWNLPREVRGTMLARAGRMDSPAPVPTEFSGELFFEAGVSASFYCSFVSENEQWANISGTRGRLFLQDFVLPFSGSQLNFDVLNSAFHVKGCDFRMEPNLRRVTVAEHSHGHADAQESNLFRHFSQAVQSGVLHSDWPAAALKTEQVMCACWESAQQNGRLVALTPSEASRRE